LTEGEVIRVAAFTAGRHIPGSRFRVRQYIQPLTKFGIELFEFFTSLGAYPPKGKIIRPLWALSSIASRLPSIVRSYHYDVTLFQREMLSTFFTLESFTKSPRILDVDDAIWLNGNGSFARRLAEISDSVICGNSFLAEYFSQWNSKISIVPTAVDTDRFLPLASKSVTADVVNARPTIGWSGAYNAFPDLAVAKTALQIVLRKYPRARLRVIADEPPQFLDIPKDQVEFVPWSPESEVQAIQSLDIGIMPLRDTLWSRGKCAYKMLLYMSCGVPVVVSPIGMTADVCQLAPIGSCAKTTEDWVSALEELLGHSQLAESMGKRAREVVLQNFSVRAVVPKLADVILQVAGRQVEPTEEQPSPCLALSDKRKV
jgi:glycosyltransferase involved in cell wall biosynthesis